MTMENRNSIIRTEVLCKSFLVDGEVNNIIKNMDLDIYEGDFTVIMGSSGSGKSTLLYSLSGMDQVTTGKVILDGEDITKMSERKMAGFRKEKIGFVFQGINLIPNMNVYENVLSPTYKTKRNKKEIDGEIDDMLTRFDMADHKKKFPTQLSGGQRQRVAICRALINHPKILFADEPTGALNSSQGKHVLDVFSKIHQDGQSVVMVTHDLKAACRGNRILFLRDGRIDGELNLGMYHKEEEKDREEQLYHFLQERNW